MNVVLSEKDYQKFVLEKLAGIGYKVHPAKAHYDRLYAVSSPELFKFLRDTQPEKFATLQKVYKGDTEKVILAAINTEETKPRGSRLAVLKHGIDINSVHLDFLYTKPATSFNKQLTKLYSKNIFSVSEEVWISDKERIDVVVFLNGFAIMAFELKANTAGQNYHDAIHQYRTERDPKNRLFRFKAGTLVNFAMDLEECYMTTKLDGPATFFLPFNQGNGEGIYAGAGNPVLEDEYSVHYMWDTILQKDFVLEIINKFMFIESKEEIDELTGKKKTKETVIFPRYHQLDVLHKILDDVYVNHSSQNYLLQHSAGSGKTYEIAWLAYRLASLHDADNKIIFDNIVICTDRVVVDRQLQKAVLSLEHQSGFIKPLDENCDSDDLRKALEGNTKITVTTIQKFPYIVETVKHLSSKTFAVIIDEAHSSTAGKNMAALTNVLSKGSNPDAPADMEDVIADEISRNGKQKNVSIFAFTATPKPTTLQLFGIVNAKGYREAFHIYSMKQAIEEGFILDVLQNYITYKTYYTLNKTVRDNPIYKTNEAKRQIARFVDLHETNISQRIEVIIEHFRTTVKDELGGTAKAMVITPSREAAVKYRQAFEDYITRKGYQGIRALVAFSGKVTIDTVDYTESSMNGFSEKHLTTEFDKDGLDGYQVLLVADKYQTGFDQKKLCAMYVLKKLHGVNTVQTFSRLNRICPPYDKHTFILDFVNDYDSVVADFSKYYTVTSLVNSVTPQDIYNIEMKLDGYYVIDPDDVEKFNVLLHKPDINSRDKKSMEFLLQKAARTINQGHSDDEKREIILTIKHFVRFYEFLIQVTCFQDVELHKKYTFASYLQSYLKMNSHGSGFDLTGKIKADGFVQKKEKEILNTKINPYPVVTLPVTHSISLTPPKQERLSLIIAEINSRTGKAYDNDVAIKAMLQIRDILMKSEELKASAKNNSVKEFEFAYDDKIDDALIEGLSQNQDFFTLLLNNKDIKKEVLGIFLDEIYKSLRGDN